MATVNDPRVMAPANIMSQGPATFQVGDAHEGRDDDEDRDANAGGRGAGRGGEEGLVVAAEVEGVDDAEEDHRHRERLEGVEHIGVQGVAAGVSGRVEGEGCEHEKDGTADDKPHAGAQECGFEGAPHLCVDDERERAGGELRQQEEHGVRQGFNAQAASSSHSRRCGAA